MFVQVLEMAREMKLLKLGTLSLDGTKVKANASRHSALSHGHIEQDARKSRLCWRWPNKPTNRRCRTG